MPFPHYSDHLAILSRRFEEALAATGFDAVILPSGSLTYYYADDHAHPFHASAPAQQWLPFKLIPHLYLLIRSGQKPGLLWPGKRDFWHVSHPVPAGEWQNHWDIQVVDYASSVCSQMVGKVAWIGPAAEFTDTLDQLSLNPNNLLQHLNFQRACKTDYEINCLWQATLAGTRGHLAAREAFFTGFSEVDIYETYLKASKQLAIEEPYPGIVALNAHAAVLHYENKARVSDSDSQTLLIDAGADYLGYASDITRTYTRHSGLFGDLINALDQLQQALAGQAVAGQHFTDLHQQTLNGIAIILQESGICRHSVETQLKLRIPQVFFPHGLGHLLGLQVHDVGGHQQDRQGTLRKPDAAAPFLRLTRQLQEGMVVTIEPGLYFIPMLLEQMVNNIQDHGCDLELIETLKPYGGIRIEDNIVIGANASRNLTREAFATY